MMLVAVLVALAGTSGPGGRVAAQEGPLTPAEQLTQVELPPDFGQAAFQVYVPATGHVLRGEMLDYWRANGAAAVYGNPISELFASADGYYSQAFENGVFQYRPEFLWTDDPVVRLMPIGPVALADRLDTFRPDGRRGAGGGDRRAAAWRPLGAADGERIASVVANGGVLVEASGHTLSGDFLAWYNGHEGWFYLGNPLSEPVAERGAMVQYFDGGLLMTTLAGPHLAPLAAELAPRLGIDTSPVPQGSLPVFDESLFWTAPNPAPLGDPYATGRKRIEVSISQQTLWAYQGDTLILTTPISTGIPPNNTEQGRFHVRIKKETEDMSGFTDSTGEVIGLGDGSGVQSGIPYAVEDVPHVMYINYDAEALHGAYWHNNFGQPMSHGCINLPLDVAAFLFGWAPLGTEVWVHA